MREARDDCPVISRIAATLTSDETTRVRLEPDGGDGAGVLPLGRLACQLQLRRLSRRELNTRHLAARGRLQPERRGARRAHLAVARAREHASGVPLQQHRHLTVFAARFDCEPAGALALDAPLQHGRRGRLASDRSTHSGSAGEGLEARGRVRLANGGDRAAGPWRGAAARGDDATRTQREGAEGAAGLDAPAQPERRLHRRERLPPLAPTQPATHLQRDGFVTTVTWKTGGHQVAAIEQSKSRQRAIPHGAP